MKSKKSQIQIFETIAVLFIFFILVGIGAIFYVRIHKSNLESTKFGYSQSKSVTIAQRAMFLPELQCSEDNIIRDSCIDIWKLKVAEIIMNEDKNKIYYFDLLEFSEVNITQVYPVSTSPQKWRVYSNKIGKPGSSFITYVPISLYDPATRNYGYGILSIETQSK
ncbi:hypothetical protein HYT92_03795 [Candidatus Pacearchaeota archaeon]|nr:hypothetical protein [Candidatus Pacearchaeota archaeon]